MNQISVMALAITFGIGLLGFLPFMIGLFKWRRMRALVNKGDQVTGTVLDVQSFRGAKGVIFYHAWIEYPVFNRAPITGVYKFSGEKGLKTFFKGRKIEVHYSKEKPERFVPKEMANNKFLLIFGIIFGIIYIAISIFLYGFLKEQGLK